MIGYIVAVLAIALSAAIAVGSALPPKVRAPSAPRPIPVAADAPEAGAPEFVRPPAAGVFEFLDDRGLGDVLMAGADPMKPASFPALRLIFAIAILGAVFGGIFYLLGQLIIRRFTSH